MKLLVAGGAGFIGSHLCERLLNDGHEVLCVDNLLTGSEENIKPLLDNPRFTFVYGDVADDEHPNLYQYELDGIFHLASPASPVGYWKWPWSTIAANTTGTNFLLRLAVVKGARFLFTSTSEVYGNPLVHPQPETYFGNVNPLGPRSVYDEGKRLGETLVIEFHRRYGLDARIARLFNTYGPRNQPEDGRMVPAFISAALAGNPMQIHGDGLQTRSLCYVDDTVEGLMKLLFTPGLAGEVVNIGNPEEKSVLGWAETISYLAGPAIPRITWLPARVEDPERRRPDITKARTLLGWEPTTSAEEGLTKTIEWFRGLGVAGTPAVPIRPGGAAAPMVTGIRTAGLGETAA